MRRITLIYSRLLRVEVLTLVNPSPLQSCTSTSNGSQGIVTKFDLHTVPAHGIWHTVSVYSSNDAHVCIEAFAEWQRKCSSDLKSTIGMIIGLESVTIVLLYSSTTVPSDVFSPFDSLPAPLVVAVPPTNGTVNSLTQISASTSPSDPMR